MAFPPDICQALGAHPAIAALKTAGVVASMRRLDSKAAWPRRRDTA
jgi:hypothetical protein